MKTYKYICLSLSLSALIFMTTGCLELQEPVEVIVKPNPVNQQNGTMSKRFQNGPQNIPSAIDSAIKLAQKNSELSEKITVLKQKNQELIAENQKLKDHVATIEPKLKQTNKELADANDLLIEMRIELNNWKTDILGFREEIRDADKAQLNSLLKILKALGGEVTTETPLTQNPDETESSPTAQNKTLSKKTPVSGKTNE